MRSKTSDADEVLEPLPVYDDDGVAIEPEAATTELRPADARAAVRELFEALRAVADEASEVRTNTPWTASEPVVAPTWRTTRFVSTFSRMIALHPAQLARLPQWWTAKVGGARLRVGRRLLLEPPRPGPRGMWRLSGRLRSRWMVRSIPVELQLWPHLGAWTKVSLEPQRRVHAGRRYFRKGHRALDVLGARLIAELPG